MVIKEKEYICCLAENDFDIKEEITCDREANVNLCLGFANLKKDKNEFVLQKCTETGVNSFILFNGENSVKKTDRVSFEKILPRYRKIIREACEQSLRLREPSLEYTEFENIDLSVYDRIFVTDETGENLNSVIKKEDRNILLLIGPEGGFSQKEFDYIIQKGGKKVSFGKRILKSETASVAISASIINFYE